MTSFKSLLGKKKSKNKTPKDWRLVGFFDSPDVHSQLILIALGMEEAKSKLLRRVVSDWLKSNNAVQIAVNQIRTSPEARDPAFRGRLEKFLQKKGVSRLYIDKVLKQL